ncbi:hypothetical protein Droror1_Dr00012473 [Drosera rotundifolia]
MCGELGLDEIPLVPMSLSSGQRETSCVVEAWCLDWCSVESSVVVVGAIPVGFRLDSEVVVPGSELEWVVFAGGLVLRLWLSV